MSLLFLTHLISSLQSQMDQIGYGSLVEVYVSFDK